MLYSEMETSHVNDVTSTERYEWLCIGLAHGCVAREDTSNDINDGRLW